MTFIYELDQYSPLDVPCERKWTSHVKALEVIVWQTDRQTDTTEIIYHAASRVVSKHTFIDVAFEDKVR